MAAPGGTGAGELPLPDRDLTVPALLLGNSSRTWVHRLRVTGERSAVASTPVLTMLRRSVLTELVVAATVLGVTAVLVNAAPARSTVIRAADSTIALSGGNQLRVAVTPARPGANTVRFSVLAPHGEPVDTRSVTAFAELPGSRYDRLPVTLSRLGPGDYQAVRVALPVAGAWHLIVTVRLSEFDAYTVHASVTLR
ncbi:MAG: hypothetical protein HYR62_03015 [Actinobacteria bacterium]|nr:hypothetical protein [Actinomycetota bacterium]MBI3686106.1 hypothetical protein [Actinomycetota bacterium]